MTNPKRLLASSALLVSLVVHGSGGLEVASGAEPDPAMYWKVDEVRPGMKGTGRTVMVGTKPEEFEAEVLGVLRDVRPGHDIILCRLRGCNLEHSGIIQGMSGSPIYIDGKLLGAVSYSWEFAKDPIAGITPFEQMVAYCRSNDRRHANPEKADSGMHPMATSSRLRTPIWALDPSNQRPYAGDEEKVALGSTPAGLKPIMIPLSARGFHGRSLNRVRPNLLSMGMIPADSGAIKGDKGYVGDSILQPGAPLVIPLVTGDFDLSGAGTVTHVEGDRVYGFGHPMFNFGECSFPMFTGYVHTVYPRANVSMKLTAPLKVVGIIDTDVSTAIAGRIGGKPDMLEMTTRIKSGRFADPKKYHVQMVRDPYLTPMLVRSVLFNSVDSEGNLPDDLTARVRAVIRLKGRDPLVVNTMASNIGQVGIIGDLIEKTVLTPFGKVRIEGIDCDIEVLDGTSIADIESARLASSRLEPGGVVRVSVKLNVSGQASRDFKVEVPLPADLPEGRYQMLVCGATGSIRRRFEDAPQLMRPRDLDTWLHALQYQADKNRNTLYIYILTQKSGRVIDGQAFPDLPGSMRAVMSGDVGDPNPVIRSSLTHTSETPWLIDGGTTVYFTVLKDQGFSTRTLGGPGDKLSP